MAFEFDEVYKANVFADTTVMLVMDRGDWWVLAGTDEDSSKYFAGWYSHLDDAEEAYARVVGECRR